MWAYGPKIAEIGNFCCINVPKRGIPLKRFLKNLAWGRESQVRTLIPNFTVLALKMWAYSLKNCENRLFWYKFAFKGKFWGPQKKLNIGEQLQTFLDAVTP